jgi:glycerol-3-phosphate dehydrogenase (NAD(P)+)
MKISLIGFGSWGIPLASLLNQNGHEVTAWDNENYINELLKTRVNKYLPKYKIPSSINITHSVEIAAQSAEMFVFALASKDICAAAKKFAPFFGAEKIIINVSKGLIEDSRICEYLQKLTSSPVAVLTGPSHAEEVLKNIPTAVVAASENEKTAEVVQNVFAAENFRVYTSTDIIGAEIGGALKNIIAVAAGCSDGLGFGDNTKAALITRGIAEITRLGIALGAKKETFGGLSGIGDLIVTCTSQHSRNWRAGHSLAQGNSLAETLTTIGGVAEGVDTAKTALRLARKHSVNMPIVEEINKILFENKNPKDAVVDLMLRDKKGE